MGIDQPWEHDPVSGVNDDIAGRHEIIGASLDGDDIPALHHHAPVLDNPVLSIHRENEPVLDRDARHREEPKLDLSGLGRTLKRAALTLGSGRAEMD
jgi:hypothetical protein